MNTDKFIKYEEWEDYWCFKPLTEMRLETFVDFNNDSWMPPKTDLKIIIESSEQNNQPTNRQLESFSIVEANQIQIIESIYNFHKNFVFPLYNASMDLEEYQIISNQTQTNKVYSIKSIRIPQLSKEKSNYFILDFHFNYDDEHDMSFLFKDLTVIDFVGLGDDFIDFKELYENGLKGDNLNLTIAIYDKPNSTSVYKGKHSIQEKIDFPFEDKAYTIGVYREKWPQSFKLFFNTKGHQSNYSLIEIMNLT